VAAQRRRAIAEGYRPLYRRSDDECYRHALSLVCRFWKERVGPSVTFREVTVIHGDGRLRYEWWLRARAAAVARRVAAVINTGEQGLIWRAWSAATALDRILDDALDPAVPVDGVVATVAMYLSAEGLAAEGLSAEGLSAAPAAPTTAPTSASAHLRWFIRQLGRR
jgi:hypothetical protein